MTPLKIKMIDGYQDGPNDQIISFTEQNLRVKFPESFLECIRQCDGGHPEKEYFSFIDCETQKKVTRGVGGFRSFNPRDEFNILRGFFSRSDGFPRELLAFSDVGDGNLICFDYSIDGWEDPDPPVVFWNFYAEDPSKAVSDVAITFEAFLKILRPYEED